MSFVFRVRLRLFSQPRCEQRASASVVEIRARFGVYIDARRVQAEHHSVRGTHPLSDVKDGALRRKQITDVIF
jgi:hypothetical protein